MSVRCSKQSSYDKIVTVLILAMNILSESKPCYLP